MIPQNDTGWIKTPFANLYKSPSGIYWMKAKIKGKLVRKSLKTGSFEIAKKKLKECHAQETKQLTITTSSTFAAVSDEWLALDARNHEIKDSTKKLHKATVGFLLRSWPGLEEMNVAKIKNCEVWARRVRDDYSPQRLNSAIMAMRAIFKLAIKMDLRLDDPTASLEFATCRPKETKLPSSDQFAAILAWFERRPKTQPSAILVRVLAFTGVRVGEAKKLEAGMVHLEANEIRLPGRITKNGLPRSVPIISELKSTIQKLLDEYKTGRFLPVFDIRSGLTASCVAVGAHRITHHDLRKLFTTRCIESGVDVRTLAQWLGHVDGGSLLLKTYAHLRNEHSQSMAKLVRFGPEPDAKTVAIPAAAV